MTADPTVNIALYYDPDGYVERLGPRAGRGEGPAGLMGRQVAGREFLDAYLTHGRWDTLTAVVHDRKRAEPLIRLCHDHSSSRGPQRRLRIVPEPEFPAHAAANPDSRLLYTPFPPDERFAWARHTTGTNPFALFGVTHTLASPAAAEMLCRMVTAPFESFDVLACTSRAVVNMVRAITSSYADYLRERLGGNPTCRIQLETVPLGVDPDKYQPPTAEQRGAARAAIEATDDEVVVLCVGRLSHHAKAHPFPLFHACDQAARRSGRKVHLVFAGWAAHPAVGQAFRSGARYFASAARVTFVDGQDPAVRASIWHAADVFASLPDNIQETFGLVVTEAMATGLPVLGSDWDGYRDLVADGETGFVVPTRMITGATANATSRLLAGQTTYDQFLAECCQAAVVDAAAAADALTRLVAESDLRNRMGTAGRQRVMERFTWAGVIREYERIWARQILELAAFPTETRRNIGPARYPSPEQSFAGYPTHWLTDADRVIAPDGASELTPLLMMPLTNLAAERRCSDKQIISNILKAAAKSCTIGELATILERAGVDTEAARATLAWLLKYNLLRPVIASNGSQP